MSTLQNKVVVFTGATSGLGKVAALKTAQLGARVIALVRDITKGESLMKEFDQLEATNKGFIELINCDLSSIRSIIDACQRITNKYETIDILVNNAGTWNFLFSKTPDSIENTLQVNLLAPILITKQLLPNLKKSTEPKVIYTASGLHQGSINFNDIEYSNKFSGFKAYRQSKLGIILITRLYQQKFEDQKIQFYSQHPGLVDTDLVRKGGWFSKLFFKIFGISPEKGAKTLLHLITSPVSELKGGEYYANEKVKKTDTKESYDLELANRLENVCNKYLENYLKN